LLLLLHWPQPCCKRKTWNQISTASNLSSLCRETRCPLHLQLRTRKSPQKFGMHPSKAMKNRLLHPPPHMRNFTTQLTGKCKHLCNPARKLMNVSRQQNQVFRACCKNSRQHKKCWTTWMMVLSAQRRASTKSNAPSTAGARQPRFWRRQISRGKRRTRTPAKRKSPPKTIKKPLSRSMCTPRRWQSSFDASASVLSSTTCTSSSSFPRP